MHYSNLYKEEYFKDIQKTCSKLRGHDKDLATYFKMIKVRGKRISGKEIDEIFEDIPNLYYIDSIVEDIKDYEENIIKDPIYTILNLVRTLAFLQENVLLSKREAGKWGISHLNEHFTLINDALICYSGCKEMEANDFYLKKIAKDLLKRIDIKIENEGEEMFREMRRFKQVLSSEECIDVLKRGTNGVLAVIGDEDYPYTVPLSYSYYDSKIYFHSAKAGHKIDALGKNDKVSFCVVDADNVVPEKYTTYFRSVVVFGKAHLLKEEEKRFALELLIDKYSKEFTDGKEAEISGSFNAVSCIELTIEHMSGKEAIEYVREKESSK